MEEIQRQRSLLEAYIARDPQFETSLKPVGLLEGAPEVVRRMAQAAWKTGVGPMAAVAGTMAQLAARAALADGAVEAIVENGGDIYLVSPEPVRVGLYAGDNPLAGKLAFEVVTAEMPLSICSSSSRMGHSLSLGDCDLATVVSKDAGLADAAATLAGNLVKEAADIRCVLESVGAIAGILGLLLVKGEAVGLAGDLPRLLRAPAGVYGL